ncbi:MAG: hydrogenase maturation protease [Anaerolineae bacterium]|nr:hydrogenase maturation protease [Anaerolineae bacterium]
MVFTSTDILVVGLGNPILSDDGIGWRVAAQIRERLHGDDSPVAAAAVDIKELAVGGLTLAETLIGYRRVIIIDAIMTVNGVPGTVYHFKLANLPGTLNTASAHDTNLITAMHTLRRYGAKLPAEDAIDIVAVEAQVVLEFSEQCTPEVEASIPEATARVLKLLQR